MDTFLKILYLEDRAEDAEIVLRLLKKSDFRFESLLAMDQKEFLEALDSYEPDIILSDNSLPHFNASEALRIVQQRCINVPFILVTGAVSEEFAAQIIKLGADDYILKDRLTRLPAAMEAAIQKKQAEADLRTHEMEINFQSELLAAVGQSVIATDLEGRIIYWNKAAENNYGWKVEEVIGRQIVDVTPSVHSREQSITIMDKLAKGNSWSGEFMVQRKDGSTFPALVTDSPIRNQQGDLIGIIGVSTDISEQKKIQQDMEKMEMQILNQRIQEQKKISRAIIKGQEEERNHVGKELHDNINQILAGIKLYLTMASKKNETVRELIKYPLELLETSMDEIRSLSSKYVSTLRNVDLKKEITELTKNLNQSTSIKVVFKYNVTTPVADDELKLNIYRITQELVNNIIKHAAADNVSIIIGNTKDEINIHVSDDGNGFNVNKKRKGIGISNIMDRTESFNGKINIESSPGKGCNTHIVLPL
jgi:two-component system, NarL family, sensor histidine kinase UhpB